MSAAQRAVEQALAAGAQEAKVYLSRATHAELSQRGGQVEKSTEATTRDLWLSVLVDDRFSSHSTSDLRPGALEHFIRRAVEATRYLEPDPDRRMLPREQMGALDPGPLELEDPDFGALDPDQRARDVAALEAAITARDPGDLVSTTAHTWAVHSASEIAFSNGFDATVASTSFGLAAEATVREAGGRLPEASAFFSARYRGDVPGVEVVAETLWRRIDHIRGAGPCESGRYPMLVEARSAGRLLSTVLGALSGSSLWQGRSMFQDKLGEPIASEVLSLYSDPGIPRGLGSHTFDGDGQPARRRVLIEGGVLRAYLLDVYHARKLGAEPTSGRVANVVVPPGGRSPGAIAADLGRVIRVESFLGGNANPTSGDFSFGIRGRLLEGGEPVKNLSEMNISGNFHDLLRQLAEVADDPWPWSSYRVPTLLFDGVQFSGT